MEFKYRAGDKELTRHSTPYSVEEMEQEQGHFPFHNTVRGAIQIDPEMKKIRKEIHDTETARRPMLGDKRSRENILETGESLKGIGLTTVAEELSLEERIYKKVEERFGASLEKKIAASLEKRFAGFLDKRIEMSLDRLLKMSATGEHTLVPFGQLSLENMEEVLFPPNESRREEKQIAVMELPAANRCGEKRKAVSPVRLGANESTSEIAKKMVNKAWACDLCQVSGTGKDSLDNHVRGKKHMSKEASSKLQSEVKDTGNGLLHPNKKAKGDADTSEIELVDVLPQEQAASECKKSGDPKKTATGFFCEVCKVRLTSKHVFDDHMQGKKHKSKEAALKLYSERKHLNNSMPHKETEQKSGGEKDKYFLHGCEIIDSRGDDSSGNDTKSSQHEKESLLFWCKTCNVRANSEIVMETHRKGKKHLNKLRNAVPLPTTTKVLNNVVASNVDDPLEDGEVDLCRNVDADAAVVEVEVGDDKPLENVDSAGVVKQK